MLEVVSTSVVLFLLCVLLGLGSLPLLLLLPDSCPALLRYLVLGSSTSLSGFRWYEASVLVDTFELI